MLDRTQPPALQLGVSGPEAGPAPSPVEALFARSDATLDAEFTSLFGPGGSEVRASLERIAATEGPAAYDRFRADPDAFGTVVGERARADTVGGALEALNYSKAYHAAEQEGRVPSVPGYGVAPQEPELSIGAYDGIYLDGEGNQIGRFGTPSDRLFVVIDAAQAGQMRQDWNAHTNTTETLQSPIRGALEIPSLTALRAMHEDITSHRWSRAIASLKA